MNKIIKQVNNNLHCYVGETLKDEPQGSGELEIYWPGPEIHKNLSVSKNSCGFVTLIMPK